MTAYWKRRLGLVLPVAGQVPMRRTSARQHAVLQALMMNHSAQQRCMRWRSDHVIVAIRTLAVETGMSRSMVSRVIEELVGAELIARKGVHWVRGGGYPTMRYRLTRAAMEEAEAYTMEMADDAFAEPALGQLGRAVWSIVGTGGASQKELLTSLGTSLLIVRPVLRKMCSVGLLELRRGRWQRVGGAQAHAGDLLRAAAAHLGTTGLLAERRTRYAAETQAWLEKYRANRQAYEDVVSRSRRARRAHLERGAYVSAA